MANGNQKRTRSERVAAIELPPNLLERVLESLQRFDVLVRISMCALAAVAMWLIVGGWDPPFSYRTGYVPQRDIVARVRFQKEDPDATRDAINRAKNQVRFVYQQDRSSLEQLRSALKNQLVEIGNAASLDALRPGIWQEFSAPPMPNVEPPTKEQQEAQFREFHDAIADKEKLGKVEKAIDRAFTPLEQTGWLEKLQQKHDEGNQTEIYVHPVGKPDFSQVVQVPEVLLGEATAKLFERLKEELNSPELAQRIFYWIKPKLKKPTLTLDEPATQKAQTEAAKMVPTQYVVFEPGHLLAREPLVKAGEPLDANKVELLRLEYQAYLNAITPAQKLARTAAMFGMFVAWYTLSGFYIRHRAPQIYQTLYNFSTMLVMFVAGVALAMMASDDSWRAELIPVMLFGMTVAIVYHQELALLLTAALALVVVVSLGQNLPQYITLMSAAATAILFLGRIRSRSKLIYVGLVASLVAMLTDVGVSTLESQLPQNAWRVGLWAVVAGFLMTGLLPFVEKAFGVLTDISLLEIGDVSHPLLQELVRRAPGTYNHSINVASIGAAAAETIGARGLLVRVGAYFHDIGKMLKPQYFAENQGQGGSLHETLLPAMSRLIIVAHVKDGADLARQHNLPQPIIDFIEQHHGTTLVEYFYRRAAQQSEADPSRGVVEEHSYRYPGPKPKTKEAGVLMLADAVESASRTLVEPTPSRLESLVHEMAMNRLLDGQFDDSGLSLEELHDVEQSLVKSLTAVYHGRVKYPEQKTA
ncbi:MAG: HDIG domain-containing protein [Pirellulales bacterium]|nr:HDIG domain-containing protein [Pirellulales bacterium]